MKALIAVFAGALLLTSCASMGENSGPSAVASLKPTQGNKAAGTVTFTKLGDQVRVVANLSGLTPGLHGIHVHTNGDCSAPDAMSAGGHFNPNGNHHGDVQATDRHAGDLGNIKADSDGNARLDVSVWGLSFTQGADNNVIGRSVIVHASPDDLKSQPAGNSGPRVACGVVAAAAPPAKSEPAGSSYRY